MFTGVVRAGILYLIIIAGVRLMGKRQVGELEPSELVLSLIIADLASVPMQDYGIPLLTGVAPILTLLALTMVLSVGTMKSRRLRALLCGRPSMVIRNGKLDVREMRRNRLTVDELLEELRCKGYADPAAIRYAILETNGQLSVLPYAAQKPPTAQQMALFVAETDPPRVLVSDGEILEGNLRALGRDRNWLNKQLKSVGCAGTDSVFLLLSNGSDPPYVVEREGEPGRGEGQRSNRWPPPWPCCSSCWGAAWATPGTPKGSPGPFPALWSRPSAWPGRTGGRRQRS